MQSSFPGWRVASALIIYKAPLLLPTQKFDEVAPCRNGGRINIILEGYTMQKGTVKWFNTQKGYGFVQPDAGGPDVFVHISAVERAGLRGLNEGQKISYEIVADKRTGKSSADQLQAV